ncbi:hypothetical protein JS562_51195 [Agrobacterium sp. S2]|nr:hypothetical protein [Agrobacterium sp. S2]
MESGQRVISAPGPTIPPTHPASSPTSTVYVVIDQASSGTDAWDIVSLLAPFAVSLIALLGVVWSSRRAAESTIKAEDRRHANTLDHDDRAWRRQTLAETYFRTLDAADRLADAARSYAWFTRPNVSFDHYEPCGEESANAQILLHNTAGGDLSRAVSAIMSVGSPQVAALASELLSASNAVIEAVSLAIDHAEKIDQDASSGPMSEESFLALLKSEIDVVDSALGKLTAEIRKEFNVASSAGDSAPVTPPDSPRP